MPQRAKDPHVNPSDETIGTKGLAVRFLLTGDNSNGSVAAFELIVPAAQRLPAPAHSHDHLRRDDLRHRRCVDLDRRRKADRCRAGTGAMHSARRRSSVRQQRKPGREGALRDYAAAIGPEYFREAFAVLNAAAGGPPDRAKMAEIMRRHGLTPAVPSA